MMTTLFHTVVSGNPSHGGETGKVFDSGLSGPTALTTKGKTFSHTFTEKGEFPYFCQLQSYDDRKGNCIVI